MAETATKRRSGRKRMITFLGLGVVGVALWSFLSKAKALTLLNFYISSIKPWFSGLSPMFDVKVMIQNPSNETFTVKAFVGNMFIDGQPVGNVSNFSEVTIPPASQATYTLAVRLSVTALVSDVIAVINQGSGLSHTLTFSGTVNANGLVTPLELTYKIF